MLPKRERAAFLMSVEELFALAKQQGRQVYFWTFTWAEPMAYWCYGPSWHRFSRWLVRDYTSDDFAALRVWERHPQGHGLHVHMLCNERLDVNHMRQGAVHFGLGYVLHVRKAIPKDAGYLSKYMTKDGRIPGVRQWAKLGNWEHVKCCDLEFHSKEADHFRAVNALFRAHGMTGHQAYVASRVFVEKEWRQP